MSRLFPSKHRCLTVALALILAVGSCYMWQARTTKDGAGFAPCFHAHFEPHNPRPGPRYDLQGKLIGIVEPMGRRGVSTDLTFIRHYHSSTQLGYCAGHAWDSHAWKYGGGWLDFEVREYEPTERWPAEFGSYVIVRHTREQLFPIYIGYTDDLKKSLSSPQNHENADCIYENGATHIHARLGSLYASARMTYMVRAFDPPCN